VKRISILLITVALIVGMTGCLTPFRVLYELTISSTEGGSVTYPGEGTFAYYTGEVVNLVAEADEGYIFVNWTGNVSAITGVYAASTTITINGHYSITAKFVIAIEIRDWYDLDAVRNNLDGDYILMNDLDSITAGYEELASPTANEGAGWQPIGTFDNPFTGTFDGQGYEICDLFINRPSDSYVALFGCVGDGGVVKNLGVVNANVTGYEGVGGLVAFNDEGGTMDNCYSTGNVTGGLWVGGLMGGNAGTVSNSYSTGSVTGNVLVGGLVGWNEEGTVSDSFWDTETSGQSTSAGGTGKNTTEMQDIATFSGAGWDIVLAPDPTHIWNIYDGVDYPFLSWQPIL
jgi:hypothetical protein